jgi:carboxymethylenebutenolidase
MVVMPDVRGLHQFYKELAQRFAEAGIDAVAIDYFGRTAGDGPRDEDFDFRAHTQQTTPEGIAADVGAAVEFLRSGQMGDVRSVFTVGFCFGGAQSWRQSAAGHGLAGCIGFYGVPDRVRDTIPGMSSPLLLLVAGADFTPLEEFQKFDGELTEAGVPHRMVVYDGAPHSFFDRTFEEHRDACEDAWRQILAFVKENAEVGQTASG